MANEIMHREYANLIPWWPFTPVADADLDRVEKKIKRALPTEYREFLKAVNGGSLECAVSLPPGGEGELISFKELVSVDRLIARWKTHKKQSKTPWVLSRTPGAATSVNWSLMKTSRK